MLITEPDDLVIVRMPLDNPTFITEKTVSGEIKLVDWDSLDGLDNKIVAIEYADPGFDHIFSQNILGLVTKFGGANSHMAIRCAEFGLPAAIGCGQRRYDELVRAGRIEIDANNKRINVIGH